jgi:hypothetical protein
VILQERAHPPLSLDEFVRLPWFHFLVPVSDHPNDPGYRKRNCELLLYGGHLFELRHLMDSDVERRTAVYRETLCYMEWGKARDDFAAYRKVIRREMLWDWWPQEVSEKLQQFYQDLKDSKRPKVAIMAPPQHGKSTAATDFVTWVAGQDPNLKTIFASFSDTLGERTNKEVQRILRTDAYIKIFGRTRLDIPGWSTNTSLIEFGDFKGSFRNTTVEGSINGLELHLGIIDDSQSRKSEPNWYAVACRHC